MHPKELLPDYVLGLLPAEQKAELEAHLGSCDSCRRDTYQLREGMVAMVEVLPETTPPRRVRKNLQATLKGRPPQTRRPAPARRGPWVVTAGLLLILAIAALGWGIREQLDFRRVAAERQVVANWLARSDVETLTLPPVGGQTIGSVLLLSDERALFVLKRPPPRGSSYQAWGNRRSERTSLGSYQRTVFEVRYTGFDSLGVSLEPKGGSPQPTRPLGRVPVF